MTNDLVYLAGPINGCSDSECNDWRQEAKVALRFETLDPMRRDYRGIERGLEMSIVADDIEDIKASRFILVYYPNPSTGTAMEVRAAFHEFKKFVVTVVPPGVAISPWLFVHSTAIYRSLTQAVNFINGFAK